MNLLAQLWVAWLQLLIKLSSNESGPACSKSSHKWSILYRHVNMKQLYPIDCCLSLRNQTPYNPILSPKLWFFGHIEVHEKGACAPRKWITSHLIMHSCIWHLFIFRHSPMLGIYYLCQNFNLRIKCHYFLNWASMLNNTALMSTTRGLWSIATLQDIYTNTYEWLFVLIM